MASTTEAEDHLRVIRSLMEKATVYRALSTQGALVGGLLALVAGVVFAGRNDPFRTLFQDHGLVYSADLLGFYAKWFLVLLTTGGLNFYFLFRDAQRREDAFVSPGMRAALRAMNPALLCGAVFSSFTKLDELPAAWMVFYGLALLSAAHFAPRSLTRLGWAFLLAGLFFFVVEKRYFISWGVQNDLIALQPGKTPAWSYPDLLMALTFGGLHLLYAAWTFRRRERHV